MNLKQLEAFVQVAEGGSFSKAAKQLFLTQPTISAHVRSLEEELHTKLIIRTTKKTTITTKGWFFLCRMGPSDSRCFRFPLSGKADRKP